MKPSQCSIKFCYNAAFPTSYQKLIPIICITPTKRTRGLLGNLQNRRYWLHAPSPMCSACHYLPTFFLLSLSLQFVKGWNIITFLYNFIVT
jgi:hypothetical protein